MVDTGPARAEASAGRPNCIHGGRAFLHNGEEMAGRVGVPAGAPPIAIVDTIFAMRGPAGLADLRGTFSFVHWDESGRRLTLTRDCGRGEALHFFRTPDFVVFATHLPDLLAHPDVPRELDEAVLAGQAAGNVHQRQRTIYRGIERVPSRTVVTVTRETIAHRIYWQPVIAATALYSRDEDYVERARELLDRAVDRVLKGAPKFAVLASGGLDSAAVLSTLARRGIPIIPCYTLVPEQPGAGPSALFAYGDERPKTEALAAMYPALQFHYWSAADSRAHAPPDEDDFERWPLPQFNISRARLNYPLFRAISDAGYPVVLTGTAGNLSLSWAGDDLIAQLLGRGSLLEAWRAARASARYRSSSTLRVLAHSAFLPLLPDAAKELLVRLIGEGARLIDARSPIRPEIARELRLREQWQEDGYDPLPRWNRRAAAFRIARMIDRPYMMHDQGPVLDAIYGFDRRDPLADRDLFEFCLNVPARLYRRDGVERWLARAVLAGRAPPEIVGERRRGQQHIPWSAGVAPPAIAEEVERMDRSLLASRLFDVPRLRRMASDWPDDVETDETTSRSYMALDQAVYLFRFMRWVGRGNA